MGTKPRSSGSEFPTVWSSQPLLENIWPGVVLVDSKAVLERLKEKQILLHSSFRAIGPASLI